MKITQIEFTNYKAMQEFTLDLGDVNLLVMRGIKQGIFNAEDLQKREAIALTPLRKFDKKEETLEATLEAVMDYQQFLTLDGDEDKHQKSLKKTREQVARPRRVHTQD